MLHKITYCVHAIVFVVMLLIWIPGNKRFAAGAFVWGDLIVRCRASDYTSFLSILPLSALVTPLMYRISS